MKSREKKTVEKRFEENDILFEQLVWRERGNIVKSFDKNKPKCIASSMSSEDLLCLLLLTLLFLSIIIYRWPSHGLLNQK